MSASCCDPLLSPVAKFRRAAKTNTTGAWLIFEYGIVDTRSGDVRVDVVNGVDSTDLSLMTEGELQAVSGVKEEQVYSSRIDWERGFSMGNSRLTFKTGAKHRVSSQMRDVTANVYEMDEDFPYADILVATDDVIFL